jgi:hypothetical protein
VPGETSIPNRNFMNLLQMPLLFCVVCLAFYAYASSAIVLLALWIHFVIRVLAA